MSQDFNEAIQNPKLAFSDPDLKASEAVVGAHGLPLPRSGNFADVYQLRGLDGRDWAVKCFTRPVVGLDERYARVTETLASCGLPFTIEFTYLDKGIQVGGAWRPVLKMEWIEGLLLNQVVREKADNPKRLSALGQMWSKLCKRLRDSGIAHGDLQHGNVLLVEGSRAGAYGLKLIDYDGMYVPELANRPAGESGHPAYQHLGRTAKTYSPDLDRFPHLVIATALKALEVGGSDLWNRYDTGDNLLFNQNDFRNPAESKLMRELWETGDSRVRALVGRLAIACGKPIPQTPWLDEIVSDGEPLPLETPEMREAEAALGFASRVPPSTPAKPVKPITTKIANATVEVPNVDIVPLKNENPQPPTNRERSSPRRDRNGNSPSNFPRRPSRKSNSHLPYLAIGGVIVLILVVSAIVFSTGGPKSGEVAKQKPEEPTEALLTPVRDSLQPKPKDVTSPKPKDTVPTPPKPKDAIPTPPKPKDAPVATEPVLLTPRWAVTADSERAPAKLYVDQQAQTILMGSERTSLLVLELSNGSKRPAFLWFGLTGGNDFYPLDRSRVSKCAPDDPDVLTWDVKTGKLGEKYPVPQIAAGAGKATLKLMHLSPDGKYLVVARSGSTTAEYPAVPFVIVDTKTGKPLLEIEWNCGSTHFTADSSRVLVAEFNGRFRWYKLPSGELEENWEFAAPTGDNFHTVTDLSADGRVLGYVGPGRKGAEKGPCVVSGQTGDVIHRFGEGYSETSPVELSADGRLAAVMRQFDGEEAVIDVVNILKAEAFARSTTPSKQSIPTFAISARGETLIVHNPKSGKLFRFDLPGSKAP